MIKFTIDEIKNYILSQDSLGDVLYNLNEKNINKANEDEETFYDDFFDEFDPVPINMQDIEDSIISSYGR